VAAVGGKDIPHAVNAPAFEVTANDDGDKQAVRNHAALEIVVSRVLRYGTNFFFALKTLH
jgi:hypothetical protein